MNKFRTFLSFSGQTRMLLFESYFYLALGRIIKGRPFSKIAPSLGYQMAETTFALNASEKETLKLISQAVHLTSRYTFWESQCLVKAIAAMKMLERRHIESTLYLGTARDKQGEFIAHAWLRSGPFYVTGYEGMEKFTVVNSFAKRMETGM